MDATQEQKQYKIQLLLHINSVLLARINQMNNTPSQFPAEQQQNITSQYLKRVHANLQCISQINQNQPSCKPAILEPPQLPVQQPAQDILAKLYLLMSRVFEVW
ncbi:LAFE_0H11012g1_1 [Lachancea fermentati]|uniref:LAFE_0H11012g1_1 n=1 Tax=Lachancea fermentati TaxID=4955 RepID=A0A1G4MKD5_LACFM|nr:LAFE_0H11012g1_1 [Lachancea fermentati]